jgi:hypothetical protein
MKLYLEEELSEFAPEKINEEGIPLSVQPIEGTPPKDVTYIATSIGFYAKLLTSIVKDLTPKNNSEQKLCMAIITNALPVHCWNWSMENGEWRAYSPIDSYRNSMLEAVGKEAQIDRVLLVHNDSSGAENAENPDESNKEFFEPINGIYYRERLLKQMLEKWHILSNDIAKNNPIACGVDFIEGNGTLGSEGYRKFPIPLQKAAIQKYGKFYPIIIEDNASLPSFTDRPGNPWTCKKLVEEYNKLHGERGKYWKFPLNPKDTETLKHHDVMFIGLGKGSSSQDKGLWAKDEPKGTVDCEWGICLMSSMNSTTETMFLTVISGDSVLIHFNHFQDILHEKLNFSKNKLPEPTTLPVAAPPAAESPVDNDDGIQ